MSSKFPYLYWLWRYRPNRLRFSPFSPFFPSPAKIPPTTIRTSFGGIDRPIQSAESTGALKIPISLLVVVLSPKSAPIFVIFTLFSPPLPKRPQLQLKRHLVV